VEYVVVLYGHLAYFTVYFGTIWYTLWVFDIVFPFWYADLGKFLRVLQWTMLLYYLATWSILRLFGIFRAHMLFLLYIYLSGIVCPVLVCRTKKNLATLHFATFRKQCS
jgi:hypothetical protein